MGYGVPVSEVGWNRGVTYLLVLAYFRKEALVLYLIRMYGLFSAFCANYLVCIHAEHVLVYTCIYYVLPLGNHRPVCTTSDGV